MRQILGHGPIAVSDTSGKLKQPGHISELLQSWSEEGSWAGPHRPSLQALGANVSVPEPSIGATSPGHWKSSSLEALERHLMGCLDPRQDPAGLGVPWHMGSDAQVLSPPCRYLVTTPALSLDVELQSCVSAEVALCQGLSGRICYSASPKDSAVVIFLSWCYFPPGIWHFSAQLPPQLGTKVSQDSRS